MHTLNVRNVCEALPRGVELLLRAGVEQPSRNGPVLVMPCPVMTVYARPQERVLTNAVRDANPFFHIIEPLWMIRGDRSALLLNNFVKDFGERFAEPGPTQLLHGAYGWRWRHHFCREVEWVPAGAAPVVAIDQLDWVVERLRRDPNDRQAVLTMWDPAVDSNDEPLKDRPCNTQIYLRVREEPGPVLDMTVLCRSNDIIWGAYGANAVHFSFIQEYMAARIGVQVGILYQFSNNFHAYKSELDRLEARAMRAEGTKKGAWNLSTYLAGRDPYVDHACVPERFVDDPMVIDREVEYLLGAYETLGEGPTDEAITAGVDQLRNRFLATTVWPMLMAHRAWRYGGSLEEALWWTDAIAADDWRLASSEWLERRRKK